MARLAYLENGRDAESGDALAERFSAAGFTVDRYWAYGGEFPGEPDRYGALFLSGSPHGAYDDVPFIQREHEVILAFFERGIPMLGVCFGSQILASALCGRDQVFRRETCEVGFKWLDTTAAARTDPLMQGIDARPWMFVWHNDEVRGDHADMTILASTDDCPNQIWRYRDRPVWGIQGHPELTRTVAPVWFERCRDRLVGDGADVDAFIAEAADSPGGLRMLDNFVTPYNS